MVGVFVADDHELIRLALRVAFERTEDIAYVGESGDGFDIIQQVLELQPEIVLIDINLPSESGLAVTRRIKQEWPDKKVIIFTGHTDEATIFSALAAGADGYALKKSSVSLLLMAIRTVAAGASWLDPHIASRVLQTSADAWARSENDAEISLQSLSEREREVLRLIAEGLPNERIAATMGISLETVKTHVRSVMRKLQVNTRTEAAVKAIKHGMT